MGMARITWLVHNNDTASRTAHAYRADLSGPLPSTCGRPVPAMTLPAHGGSPRCGTCVRLATDVQ